MKPTVISPGIVKCVPDPVVRVPMGEYRIATSPASLVTRDLGSCVGVSLYNRQLRIGGLIHVAFPGTGQGADRPEAHADMAIAAVVSELERLGSCRVLLEVKIAGGSNMYGFEVLPDMDIGALNIDSVRRSLDHESLRVCEEDLAQGHPRTMVLELVSGRVLLSTSGNVYRVM